MNESLAKQLHDLIGNYKTAITYDFESNLRVDLNTMEEEINKLIEKNKNTQEKPNE